MKIVHFITGLNTGGAEMMLYKFLNNYEKFNNKHLVVCLLSSKGTIGPKIEKLGVEVINIGLNSIFKINLFQTYKKINKFKPDILQGWMYHANFIMSFFHLLLPKTKMFWGIRQTLYDINKEKINTRIIIYLSILFIPRVNKIFFNSNISMEQHINIGYFKKKCIFIPNGFEINPSEYLNKDRNRILFRKEININSKAIIVGLVARFHPMKGHMIFIKSGLEILKEHNDIQFLCVGFKVADSNLKKNIPKKYIKNFIFLDEKKNINQIYASIDIAVNSSIRGEGFSNAICEAMLMALPCIATKVGEAENILENDYIALQNNIDSLRNKIIDLIVKTKYQREQIGIKNRQSIVGRFNIIKVLNIYKQEYSRF